MDNVSIRTTVTAELRLAAGSITPLAELDALAQTLKLQLARVQARVRSEELNPGQLAQLEAHRTRVEIQTDG